MNKAAEDGDGAGLVLIRFSAGGVDFCADTDQIEGVAVFDRSRSIDPVWLRDELGCAGPPDHGSPVLFTVKTGTGPPYRVVVDRMQDVCQVAGAEIRPFPPLVEPFALKKGLWGVVFPGGRMALLIDFLLLEREKNRHHLKARV